jgi:DNA-binding NtrC family response regulator
MQREKTLTNPVKARVLVVDDEADLRMLLEHAVAKAGYEVVTASDGEEAISLLVKRKFDIVLLDIQMPNTNGIEVLKYIQKNTPTTKTIMLTGYADLKHAMEAREFGAQDFISKPYKVEEILYTITRLLS